MSEPAPAGVHHLAIAVRDLAATEAFYEKVLGLPILRRWAAGGERPGERQREGEDEPRRAERGPRAAPLDPAPDVSSARSTWLDLGDGAFLALERTGGDVTERDDQTPGLQMFALRISREARAGWETRLAAAGVPVVHRTAYTLYLRDPEGNRVGLSHWPEASPDPADPAKEA
jgi:glyoxylase I family protein